MRSLLLVLMLVVGYNGQIPEDYFYQNMVEKFDYSQENGPEAVVWQPKDVTLGQVSGLDTDSKDNIHIFHRGSRVWDAHSFDESTNKFAHVAEGPIKEATHLVVDKNTGDVLIHGGRDTYYMPHGLTIDGEDNIWLTDVALHQVFKLAPGQSEPELVLGTRFEPGNDEMHFCKPTSVAVAKTGEFFVADGYCNSRIVKFAADGSFMSSFGKPDLDGSAPPGSLMVPHSLVLIEDMDILCVADREHERIQCFSAGLTSTFPVGVFMKAAENLGKVYAIDKLDHFLVGVTNFGDVDENKLFIVNLNNGESKSYTPGLMNPHDLAVDQDGSIYVGEIGPNRVIRLNFVSTEL